MAPNPRTPQVAGVRGNYHHVRRFSLRRCRRPAFVPTVLTTDIDVQTRGSSQSDGLGLDEVPPADLCPMAGPCERRIAWKGLASASIPIA